MTSRVVSHPDHPPTYPPPTRLFCWAVGVTDARRCVGDQIKRSRLEWVTQVSAVRARVQVCVCARSCRMCEKSIQMCINIVDDPCNMMTSSHTRLSLRSSFHTVIPREDRCVPCSCPPHTYPIPTQPKKKKKILTSTYAQLLSRLYSDVLSTKTDDLFINRLDLSSRPFYVGPTGLKQ